MKRNFEDGSESDPHKRPNTNANSSSGNYGSQPNSPNALNPLVANPLLAPMAATSVFTLNGSFATTAADIQSLENLSGWFRSEGFVGLDNLEFKPSPNCCNTLGCFAKKKFEVGEVLFEVPQSAIVSLTQQAFESPLTSYLIGVLERQHSLFRVSQEFFLWINMIALKNDLLAKPAESASNTSSTADLGPYFQSLSEQSPSLLHWEEPLLSFLSTSNLGQSLSELKENLLSYSRLISEIHSWEAGNKEEVDRMLPQSRFNFDGLLWAAGHYLSRRYPGYFAETSMVDSSTISDENAMTRYLQGERNREIIIREVTKEPNMGNIGSLVPLLDILNHNHDREWLKFTISGGKLQVICNHPVDIGEELYSNYGHLSNEQLLYAYGYALDNNPYDTYPVKLKVPEELQQQLTEGQGGIFPIYAGGLQGVTMELFDTLKKLVALHNDTDLDDHSDDESDDENSQLGEEECEILMSYILNVTENMERKQDQRSELLKQYGLYLRLTFPPYGNDDERTFDRESFKPEAILSGFANQTPDIRAKFLSFYLIGQYLILMNLAQDIDALFQDN